MAVAALPEEYRSVSALYFTEEVSYREIAEIVGCPVGTVRSRLHRARPMLQRIAVPADLLAKVSCALGRAREDAPPR
jgi:DNA-directed RNA polymerase specialized sigma24 family protein